MIQSFGAGSSVWPGPVRRLKLTGRRRGRDWARSGRAAPRGPPFAGPCPKEVVMPHVAPLADAQAPDASKSLFQQIQSQFGMVPNIFRTMGHAPEVLRGTLALEQAIGRDLAPKLRELAYLKTSQLNGCHY